MRMFKAELRSLSPYSQGRYHETPKEPRELDQAYEERCVRFKLHTSLGEIYIPPMAFKHCLDDTVQYLGEQIPGKGKQRWTKHYAQGVMCNEPVMLGIKPEEVRIFKIFTASQPGKPDSGRVWKSFPVIDHWAGELQIYAIDDIVTADVLKRHLVIAGRLTGIGVWRPQRKGMWGKFEVRNFHEEEV